MVNINIFARQPLMPTVCVCVGAGRLGTCFLLCDVCVCMMCECVYDVCVCMMCVCV